MQAGLDRHNEGFTGNRKEGRVKLDGVGFRGLKRGMKRLRVGIVGAGANTLSRHVPGLKAIEGVEVAVLCNRTLESSQRAAAAAGVARVAADWREIAGDQS